MTKNMIPCPDGWRVTQLGELGNIKMCRRVFQHQTTKHGAVPFYKISTFGGTADAYISRDLFEFYKKLYPYPKKGDILISVAGTIGKTVVFDGAPAYFQDSNIVWLDVNNDGIDKNYLCWVYRSYPWQGLEGTTIQRLYNKIILATKILLPPLAEQRAITDTLATFDRHLADLDALIAKKQMIRDGALEDLVSGRTRLDGFSGEWRTVKLGEVLTILHGKNQHKVESVNGKYPILGSGGLIGRANEFLCNWECVLIGRKGTIDNPIYMNTPFWTIDTLYYSKPQPQQCVKFQYYLFKTISWYSYAESSGRPSLTRKAIENIDVCIPKDENEQAAIASVLSSMDNEIADLKAEREKVAAIRDGAMDDLLTGRMRLV